MQVWCEAPLVSGRNCEGLYSTWWHWQEELTPSRAAHRCFSPSWEGTHLGKLNGPSLSSISLPGNEGVFFYPYCLGEANLFTKSRVLGQLTGQQYNQWTSTAESSSQVTVHQMSSWVLSRFSMLLGLFLTVQLVFKESSGRENWGCECRIPSS